MIGETVTHYRILEKLGRGGMGVVYLAEDLRLDRKVAVKFMATDLVRDDVSRARFRNEGRAAARLSHPNIATLHDFHDDEHRPFLVFEYVEGTPLNVRLKQGPMSFAQVRDIGCALAAGLSHAHALGVVHRDVKSANVMLADEGGIKILDFGLAHREDASAVTREGDTIGTAPYMSPEQADGRRADARSDLWAVGVVLYQCLTGDMPFVGDSFFSVLSAVLTAEPEPPSAVRADVPPYLESVVLRCLEKDPARRFQTAQELLTALQTEGESLALDEAPMHDPTTTTRSVSRVARIAALLVVLAIAGLTLVPRLLDERPPRVTPGASSDEERLMVVLPLQYQGKGTNAYLTDGVFDLLSLGLDASPDLRVIDPFTLRTFLGEENVDASSSRALELAVKKYGADLGVRGNLLDIDGEVRIRVFVYDSHLAQAEPIDMDAVPVQEILPTVDLLTARILASRTIGAAPGLGDVAAYTTESPAALRAFLEGERILHHDFGAATEHYRAAVAADSTFSLALYRLSVSSSWTEQSRLAVEQAAAALRHADGLRERDKHALRAWLAYLRGEASAAIDLHTRYVHQYPEDLRGLKGLGESQFHLGYTIGLDAATSRAAWLRVLELQTNDWEAIRHLGSLAYHERDHAGYAALVERESDDYKFFARWLALSISPEPSALDELDTELRRSAPTDLGSVVAALHLIASAARRPLVASRLHDDVLDLGTDAEQIMLARTSAASIDLTLGRVDRALVRLDHAGQLASSLAAEMITLARALPLLVWSGDPSEPDREPAVPPWAEMSRWVDASFLDSGPLLAEAFDHACRGNTDAARERVEHIASKASDPHERDLAAAWARGIEATLAMNRGDWLAADQLLAPVQFAALFGPTKGELASAQWGPVSGLAVFRLLRGQALRRLGHDTRAMTWFRDASRLRLTDSCLASLAELELGFAHESAGEREAATRSFQDVASWLQQCDPSMEPVAALARGALERIE